jgi:hypothetical protein
VCRRQFTRRAHREFEIVGGSEGWRVYRLGLRDRSASFLTRDSAESRRINSDRDKRRYALMREPNSLGLATATDGRTDGQTLNPRIPCSWKPHLNNDRGSGFCLRRSQSAGCVVCQYPRSLHGLSSRQRRRKRESRYAILS